MQENGSSDNEVNKRIQAGWANLSRMTGLLCDRRVPVKVKGKLYKSVVGPAMMYGMETAPIIGSLKNKLQATELKMLRW